MNYEERTTPRVELPLHEEEYKINMAGIDSRMADVLKQTFNIPYEIPTYLGA